MQPNKKVAPSVAPSASQGATTFDAILDRLKDATNTKSDTAFAKALGLRQSSVSGAKKRGQIPPTWGVQVAEMTGASLDWLLLGESGQPLCRVNRTATSKSKGEDAQVKQGAMAGDGPDFNTAEIISKTIEILESKTVFTTAIVSNIEAFHEAIQMKHEMQRFKVEMQTETAKMINDIHKEVDQLRQENQQLRDEIQRDRDQEATKDTG